MRTMTSFRSKICGHTQKDENTFEFLFISFVCFLIKQKLSGCCLSCNKNPRRGQNAPYNQDPSLKNKKSSSTKYLNILNLMSSDLELKNSTINCTLCKMCYLLAVSTLSLCQNWSKAYFPGNSVAIVGKESVLVTCVENSLYRQ